MVSARVLSGPSDNVNVPKSRYSANPHTPKHELSSSSTSTHEEEDASVTLTFNGVQFRLTPSECNDSANGEEAVFSISRKSNGIKFNMTNFSGTLFVSSASSSSQLPQPQRQPSMNVNHGHLHSPLTTQNTFQEEENYNLSSQRSQMSRHASLTPSPPKSPDKEETEDPNMPTLSVPSLMNTYFSNGNSPRVKPQPRPQPRKKPAAKSPHRILPTNPIVSPPSVSKKRERSSSVDKNNNGTNKVTATKPTPTSTKTQPSILDVMNGSHMKKNKTNNRPEPEQQRPTTPTLGQSQSMCLSSSSQTEGSENLLTLVEHVENPNLSTTKTTSPKVRDMVKDASQCDDDAADNYSISTREYEGYDPHSSIVEVTAEDEEGNSKFESESSSVPMSMSPKASNVQNPPQRWGHTLTPISDDRLVLYGGQSLSQGTLSDIYIYNTKARSWSKPINASGLARCWHSSTYIPSRQTLISFGGESINPKTGRAVTTDQIMVLDTDIMLWYPPVCSGVKPNARSGHSACLLPANNTLVIFGGVRKGKWLNTILALDTHRWKWSSPKIAGDAPRPRSYHSSTPTAHNKIVIFGGNDGKQCFNSVHVLDANGEEWNWYFPQMKGTPPSPRTGHCATLLEDGKSILIHGGWDPNDEEEEETIFEDSFILDTMEWVWSEGPDRKYGGGGPEKGQKRVGHSGALVDIVGGGGKEVLAFGGRTLDDEFGNDFMVFPMEKNEVGLGN